MNDVITTALADVTTLSGCADLIAKAYREARDWRLRLLFHAVDHDLRINRKLSPDTIRKLIEVSYEKSSREAIYSAATKAILAECSLAIRVMAVISARHLVDRTAIEYDDLILLRGLQNLTDDEVIFGRRLWSLYSEGKLPLDKVEKDDSESHKSYKKWHIPPSEEVKKALNVSDYIPKIEQLKRNGVLGDQPHGYMGQTGGWGHAVVIDRTQIFAQYVGVAEGIPEPQ